MQIEKAYLAPTKGYTKFKHFALRPEILKLLEEYNFKRPTVVQSQSLPITLEENLKQLCIIVYAYNGAGKTLTYLIPLLNSLEMIPYETIVKGRGAVQTAKKKPQGIIILPTQALMSQVFEQLESFANYFEYVLKWPLKIGKVYAGAIQFGHIIVGLTKKITDNLKNFNLVDLKWVIFDQCDKVKDDSSDLFKQMLSSFAKQKITANFIITSATGDKEKFREFIQDNLTTHNLVQLDSKEQNMGLIGVTHYYSKVPNEQKNRVIFKILEQISKKEQKIFVIIFFNQIIQLEAFYELLCKEKDRFAVNDSSASKRGKNNLKVNYVHANCGICKGPHKHPMDCTLSKTRRVDQLRNKDIQILLGTETIGRGIDIRTVSLVINYSEPTKNKNQVSSIAYIHRVGRTGRYTDEGIALTFVNPDTGDQFIKLAESEQKISFTEMKSVEIILDEAEKCSIKNNSIQEDAKHRYQND